MKKFRALGLEVTEVVSIHPDSSDDSFLYHDYLLRSTP